MSAGSRPGSRPGSHMVALSGSSSQESFYEERCVDPVEDRLPSPAPKPSHKADLREANGKEPETVVFLPGGAETSGATQGCNPCTSPRSCRTFVCSMLTCGLYRVCHNSPDKPDRVSLQAVSTGDAKVEDGDVTDWLGDVHIGGKKVDCPIEYLDADDESMSFVRPPTRQTLPSRTSLQDSVLLDDWEEGEEDVDVLITKKLLELYSEYQIEELARCTSDSVFLKKSKAINDLINSLAAQHKMDEQEAECRLVRGIIRISTRRSSKRPAVSRRERTLSDSGNETMRESESYSFSNNNDYKSNHNIQISELTSSDECAREMCRNNIGHRSGSPTSSSRSRTEADSSGVHSARTSVRT